MYHLIDYVWCVEKFAHYFDPHPQEVYSLLTSPVFAYKNTRWVLNLYPEGLGDAASAGYISLFIKYVSEDPETINARVELSLLNNRNERVYCRDTGDHQYQTFIDFGYKQFLKIQDIRDQRGELICNGTLKVFARVEFEHSSLPASLTWTNYDLLLFKENFKDLYETKYLCDIVVRVVRKAATAVSTLNGSSMTVTTPINSCSPVTQNQSEKRVKKFKLDHSDYSSFSSSSPSTGNNSSPVCTCSVYFNCSSNYSSSPFSLSSISSLSGLNSHEYLFESSNFGMENSSNIGGGEPETLEIKSHKFILASRSGKFRELLKTNLIRRGDLLTVNSCSLMSLCANSAPTKSLLASALSNDNKSSVFEKEQQLGSSCLASSSGSSSSSSSTTCAENTLDTSYSECSLKPSKIQFPTSSSLATNNSDSSINNHGIASDPDGIGDLLIIETDRSPKVIEYLIRYMYSGYLESLDAYAKDIYEISKEYKVHGLTNLSREHIIKDLNIQNCCDYLVFCVVNNDYELNGKIQTFIRENYETIVKTNAYKQAKRKYRELFENTFNEISKKMPSLGSGAGAGASGGLSCLSGCSSAGKASNSGAGSSGGSSSGGGGSGSNNCGAGGSSGSGNAHF